MKEIRLYIGDQEVEFNNPPEILYTYQQDELNNPTVVKNSFSKTVTVEGTPNNNRLFGHYWNVERQSIGGGENSGIYFNPSKKAPFTLYNGSEIYEQGYIKLDEVRQEGGSYQYDITLYGGLGDFFYNLSTDDEGNQLKLSALNFGRNLGFTINMDTVKEAWDALEDGTAGKWQIINFMPAYNGYAEDFDNDKIIINTSGTSLTKSLNGYTTNNGFVLGTLPEEMTEWEVRDLRSYLQRPVIRMKDIINACCDPDNNGGYQVELDPDFFNEDNPYWEDTWMTLPMIRSLEYSTGEQILEDVELIPDAVTGDTNGMMYQDLIPSLGEFSQSIPSSIRVTARISLNPLSVLGLCPYTSYAWFWNRNGDSYHSGWFCMGSLFVQMIALNGDNVVGASQAYNLTSPVRHNGKLYYGHNGRYGGGRQFTPYMDKGISNRLGYFREGDGYFVNESGTLQSFAFNISSLNSNVTNLKLVFYWGASQDKLKHFPADSLFGWTLTSGWVNNAYRNTERGLLSEYGSLVLSQNIKAAIGSSMGRTGTEVSQNLLLDTENSPCDYLLSYCKMFGLYFSKDLYENKIYIQTRKTFYDRDRVTDLTPLVDEGSTINITPLSFDTKWVEFSQEKDDTQFSTNYTTAKGVDYGCKTLNTGYEFNSDKRQLLEDNVLKSGIEGLEQSKYYTQYNSDGALRPWWNWGLKYNLYSGGNTTEVSVSTSAAGEIYGINPDEGMMYYDATSKMQFHDSDNKGTDGNNCLVFFRGMQNVTRNRPYQTYYWLTDDTYYQTMLNEGTPCWLFTTQAFAGNTRIAYRISNIPSFGRYMHPVGSTKVSRSLDFGTAQELFIPNMSITDESNIYHFYWEDYLNDLYDVNTRLLTCYVKIQGNPNPDWLRGFFWFRNGIWRVNTISDYNPSSYGLTKVEFVKVQDIDAYTSETVSGLTYIRIASDKYIVSSDGDNASLAITTSSGRPWRVISTSPGLVLSSTSGTGNSTITATFPENSGNTYVSYNITAINDEGQTSQITISQEYGSATYVDADPPYIILPSSGGDRTIDFVWYNQGSASLTGHTETGNLDLEVSMADYSADVTVGENTGDTVLSGLITFSGSGYDCDTGIDQLPEAISFPASGGTVDLNLEYNTVNFLSLPFWLTASQSGKTVTFTALANYYETARYDEFTLSNGRQTAAMTAIQEAGEAPSTGDTVTVSPTELYFQPSGGTQYINVNLPNGWTSTHTGDWYDMNITNGNASSIIGVTASSNSGDIRTGTIYITDALDGTRYTVTLSQAGESTQRSFTISPNHIDAPASGGSYPVTIIYSGRNGDVVSMAGEGLEYTPISWNGDTGSTTVTVPENGSTSMKDFTLTFGTSIGSYNLTIEQYVGSESGSVTTTGMTVGSGGATLDNGVTSNVPWTATTDADWLSCSPSSGDSGYTAIQVTAQENTTFSARTGHISIKSIETDVVLATITVTQDAKIEILSVKPSTVTFPASGGTIQVTITNNTSWTIYEQ